jgi:hypothetical protein
LVLAPIDPEVSNISRILAGISALPEPGGGAFALALNANEANEKTKIILNKFITHFL